MYASWSKAVAKQEIEGQGERCCGHPRQQWPSDNKMAVSVIYTMRL